MNEERQPNFTHDDVLEVITDFPLKPLCNKVIININTDKEDGGLVLSDNAFSERQYVVSGTFKFGELEVTPGTPVLIDVRKLMKTVKTEVDNVYGEYKVIEIDPVIVDNKMYAIIEDRVIKAIDLR
jgi:co-chaperonin GroES (HSP10)